MAPREQNELRKGTKNGVSKESNSTFNAKVCFVCLEDRLWLSKGLAKS